MWRTQAPWIRVPINLVQPVTLKNPPIWVDLLTGQVCDRARYVSDGRFDWRLRFLVLGHLPIAPALLVLGAQDLRGFDHGLQLPIRYLAGQIFHAAIGCENYLFGFDELQGFVDAVDNDLRQLNIHGT